MSIRRYNQELSARVVDMRVMRSVVECGAANNRTGVVGLVAIREVGTSVGTNASRILALCPAGQGRGGSSCTPSMHIAERVVGAGVRVHTSREFVAAGRGSRGAPGVCRSRCIPGGGSVLPTGGGPLRLRLPGRRRLPTGGGVVQTGIITDGESRAVLRIHASRILGGGQVVLGFGQGHCHQTTEYSLHEQNKTSEN